ncbi:carboxylesterase/lipase family protein [Carboxylicivirga caseinilyticus]|uniref:carboxylesterase/lipase family protein n=1 Tax=Carboxylicivirga caseinilyticus TaxID=3417572 RepID=UPI003D3325DA|nr:carboxylesterase family protein [Marinilabiliaceae bacterium A049]
MVIRFFFILLLATACCNEKEQVEVVKVCGGLVSGKYLPDTEVFAYKGIPFAKPPVGDLRWKAPQPVDSWDGVRDCTAFSASAMQFTPQPFLMWTQEFIAPAEPLSEDCLYLNVWTAAKKEEKQPVIVFIHGGGFSSGSGSVPIYDGANMAAKGAVFVTINYRVGIFGFFAHPELSKEAASGTSGNYGLLDQIAALKWVRDNIGEFGGDPDNVTIAGQSAGAFSVNYLVASPLAKGLFHRAIAESGGAVMSTNRLSMGNTLVIAESVNQELGEHLEITSIADFRAMPADSLLKLGSMSIPVVDGYVLPKDVHSIFTNGEQNDVPVLLGWNANEGNFGGPLKSAADFKNECEQKYGERASEFLEVFPAQNDSIAQASQIMLSGLQTFGIQAYKWAELQNQKESSPAFVYFFNRSVPYGEGQQDFGAFHTSEVSYAYCNLDKSSIRPWTQTDYQLEKIMSSYWINFARNGNPNRDQLPIWKPYTKEMHQAMILGEKTEMKELPHLDELNLIESIFKNIKD